MRCSKEESELRFINNPIEILFEIVNEKYPGTDCDIIIGMQMTDGKETLGCTLFPDDPNERVVIEINPTLSLENATEILAHELAHVIAGKEADHNEQWDAVFADLHERFQVKMIERFEKFNLL